MKNIFLTLICSVSLLFISCGEDAKEWSESEKESFISDCMLVPEYNSYCDCVLNVLIENKYELANLQDDGKVNWEKIPIGLEENCIDLLDGVNASFEDMEEYSKTKDQ